VTVDDLIKQAENKIDQLLSCISLSADAYNNATHNKDMAPHLQKLLTSFNNLSNNRVSRELWVS